MPRYILEPNTKLAQKISAHTTQGIEQNLSEDGNYQKANINQLVQ